jgi:hypothetical protein
MRLVAKALGRMKVVNRKQFLKDFATTLPPCKFLGIKRPRIYLPFEPGEVGRGAVPLHIQVEVICHEFHHVRQIKKDKFKFPTRYLTKKAHRAWYEQRCFRVNMELHWFLTLDDKTGNGKLLNTNDLAYSLRFYACRQVDIDAVAKELKIISYSVSRGKLHNQVSKDAIAFLRRRRPNLSAKLNLVA